MTSILPQRRRVRMLAGLALLCGCNVYELPTHNDTSAGGQSSVGGSGNAGAGTPTNEVAGSGVSSAGASGDGGSAGGPSGGTGAGPNAGSAGTAESPASAGAPSHGGSSASGGSAGGAAMPERVLELIDDMEDGDAFVLPSKGRNGHWDVSNDATAGAMQTPLPASFSMTLRTDPGPAHFAAYTQGTGFKDWGAFMTVSMRTWPKYEETPVYDASKYLGISFYAKVGAGSDAALRVRFIGAQTDPRGGQCTPGGSIDTACYDHFLASVKLTQEWQRVELLFADFQQSGVGKSFPSIDLTGMYALEFLFPGRKTASGNAFELWVDDLSFIVQ